MDNSFGTQLEKKRKGISKSNISKKNKEKKNIIYINIIVIIINIIYIYIYNSYLPLLTLLAVNVISSQIKNKNEKRKVGREGDKMKWRKMKGKA
jgi:hypothetical protein